MAEESAFLGLLITGSITWPQKGDRLLRDANDWEKGVGFRVTKSRGTCRSGAATCAQA